MNCDIECNKINKGLDQCIKSLIEALNASGLETVASCCGHGKTLGNIVLKDGREIFIVPDFNTARRIESQFPDIHGRQIHGIDEFIILFIDKHGVYEDVIEGDDGRKFEIKIKEVSAKD